MAGLDVAIVGGGVAGIAAARRLQDLGRSVLLVEALPRLGGRAHTVALAGHAVDLGCGWLHSVERNPLAPIAEGLGLPFYRSEGAWCRQLRNLGISAHDQHAAWTAYERWSERLRTDPPASDCAADAMPAGDRWRGFVDGLSSFINGTELDRLSAADFVSYDDAATETNWRLESGYGAFLAGLGGAVPALLDTPVTSITTGADVALETAGGTIHARAAIVAVSTAVLTQGRIRFPAAADDHLHAATGLPLGLADKIFFAMADPDAVPPESHLLGRADTAATGSYYLRPFGRALVECYLGGRQAEALEHDGEAAAVAFAIGELRALLGSDFVKGLSPLVVTQWRREPTIGGSYSHALPGRASARPTLARPVDERLCFAGEACSVTDFSTAHGAWQSGIAAADAIDRGLGRARLQGAGA